MRIKLLQSCLTFCNPTDYSPPGSWVHGNLQATILGWVAMPSSRRSSWPRDWTHISYNSCTDRWFFTTSASWEAPYVGTNKLYFIQTYLPLPQMYELWALNPFSLPGLPFPAYQKSIVILQTKDFKYQKLYEITPLILPCQIRCELSPLWIWIHYDSDSINIIY